MPNIGGDNVGDGDEEKSLGQILLEEIQQTQKQLTDEEAKLFE